MRLFAGLDNLTPQQRANLGKAFLDQKRTALALSDRASLKFAARRLKGVTASNDVPGPNNADVCRNSSLIIGRIFRQRSMF